MLKLSSREHSLALHTVFAQVETTALLNRVCTEVTNATEATFKEDKQRKTTNVSARSKASPANDNEKHLQMTERVDHATVFQPRAINAVEHNRCAPCSNLAPPNPNIPSCASDL